MVVANGSSTVNVCTPPLYAVLGVPYSDSLKSPAADISVTNRGSICAVDVTATVVTAGAALTATTAGSSPLRLVVVYDRQSNAVAPLATDVFQIDQISSMMNLSNGRRFKVIIDELVENVSSAGPSGWNRKLWRDFTAKGTKPGLEVTFNTASTATISSIQTGSLYAFVWQNGNLITAAPTQALYSRVRFVDN